MSIHLTRSALSYTDILAARLLPSDFELPALVKQLPLDSQTQLLRSPLTLVFKSHPLYQAQRALLQSIGNQPCDYHLRTYCRGLYFLSQRAWEFVAKVGKTMNVDVPATVAAGTLNDMEGPSITTLSVHWHELRRHVGASLQLV